MTVPYQPTDKERRHDETAIENFMDLLARLIAREHLRRNGDNRNQKNTNPTDGSSEQRN